MKYLFFIITILAFMVNPTLHGQDSLISLFATQNLSFFTAEKDNLKGDGWDKIRTTAQNHDNVFIGESHFHNEIPSFVAALAKEIKFDNFICETDPYSMNILKDKIQKLNAADLNRYKTDYGNTFSFFALEPEFRLLRQMIQGKTRILGLDQIVMNGDRLVFSEMKKKTLNQKARSIYGLIESESKVYFDKFLKDPSKPMYMLTPDFERNMKTLSSLKLSKEETKIIDALNFSKRIYMEQSHTLRIQLMKNQLMAKYKEWYNQKNLFKFGALHMAKGESYFKVFDIGNIAHNVADGQFKKSMHILIVGKSGMQGGPFEGFPSQTLDAENGDFKFLKPFFKTVNGEMWHCFDLQPLQKLVETGQLQIRDLSLLRTINGYDLLVIIPTVTAAGFK